MLLLDSSYSKHSKDKPNASFIMLSVSVRCSACFGTVTSGKLRPDINAERAAIEAQGRLRTKNIIFEMDSDTTGSGTKEHRCFCLQEPKGHHEMVIDKVRVID